MAAEGWGGGGEGERIPRTLGDISKITAPTGRCVHR